MSNTVDRELGWDDEIEKDSEFILLPAGEYDFTVKKFERGRHQGSEKLPPCNKAIISIVIADPASNQEITLEHNLFLHTKTEGMVSAFFVGIGQKKKGEKLKMDWNAVIGATGRCKLSVRTWKHKDSGDDMQSNEIRSFLPKEVKEYKAGEF